MSRFQLSLNNILPLQPFLVYAKDPLLAENVFLSLKNKITFSIAKVDSSEEIDSLGQKGYVAFISTNRDLLSNYPDSFLIEFLDKSEAIGEANITFRNNFTYSELKTYNRPYQYFKLNFDECVNVVIC